MTQLEFLLSEVAWLTRELEYLPDSAPITKASTRSRLAEVERQLEFERSRKATTVKGRFVSGSCLGEICSICIKHLGVRVTATCKVGEEIAVDDPNLPRHNLTAYLCSRHFDEIFSSSGAVPVDRESLGKIVREVWIEWAKEQPSPKPSWLVPWEGLSESDKEVDRRIGERLLRHAHTLATTQHLRIREATQKLVAEFGSECSAGIPASLEDMIEKAIEAKSTPLRVGG